MTSLQDSAGVALVALGSCKAQQAEPPSAEEGAGAATTTTPSAGGTSVRHGGPEIERPGLAGIIFLDKPTPDP